jgi:hypothetical protein
MASTRVDVVPVSRRKIVDAHDDFGRVIEQRLHEVRSDETGDTRTSQVFDAADAKLTKKLLIAVVWQFRLHDDLKGGKYFGACTTTSQIR